MKVQKKEKILEIKSFEGSGHHGLEQEIAIMKKIDHPNLVRLHEVINDPEADLIYMIIEFIDGGQVCYPKYLQNTLDFSISRPIPRSKIWDYFRDCIRGLDYRNLNI